MMVAPMIIIEIILMNAMYYNKIMNIIIVVSSALLLFACITFIRQQTAITDKQFLKSMIPHHAGAILMCEKATLDDTEIKKLCTSIIKSQQTEIDWMQKKLYQI